MYWSCLTSLKSYSGFTSVLLLDGDYLAVLACPTWLALWPSWCSRSRVHKYRLPGLLFSAGSADTITNFHYFGAAAVGVGPWAKTQPFVLAWRIWAVIIGNV